MLTIPANTFKLLFEQLPGLYLILNPDFTIVAVSDPYLKATLTIREEIIGRNIFDVFPDNPDDNTATGVFNLRASLNYVVQRGQPHAMADQQYDIRRPDGTFEERYWSPLNSPIFDEQQQLCYIVHKVQDVTANRKTTSLLKKNKYDFQLLVNSVKDYAIFMLDKNGCVASWNSGAEYIKGYTAEEIMGKPISVFYTAEDIACSVPQKNLLTALQFGHYQTEGWRKRKDGTRFYANIVFTSLIDDNGNHYGYAKVTKDITEKRKDEERISFLASITRNMQDPVIISDNNFAVTRWNEAAEKLLGWKSEEVTGRTTVEILKTIYLRQSREQVLATIAEKGTWRGELIYHTKSGRPVNVIATASRLKDAEGNESGNLIVVRDITDRKKAEEALGNLNTELEFKVAERTVAIRRSEKQYRYLFENNPMPMWVMDLATFKFLDVNEVALLHYGYSRDEFLSMTALDIRPEEEKKDFLQLDHDATITALNYNKGVWSHKKKDGSIIQVEIVVHDITFGGGPARLILANDVTEKKKAEEKLAASENLFRALIENSNDIISLMDNSFQLLYRSPAAARVTGWTNEDMIGMDATKNIHPDDKAMAAAIVKEVMANPGKTVHTKFRMQHKLGHHLWVEGTLTNSLLDKDVKAVVFNFRDVTKRLKAEEKLIASEKQFRNTLDNMLEGIQIHDFNWRYIYVNDALVNYSKLPREELIGYTLPEKFPGIEKTSLFKVMQRCMDNRVAEQLETEFVFPDGSKAIYQMSIQPVPEGIFILSIDITERKRAEQELIQSEENLKAIFDNASEGFILTDKNGMVKAFNNNMKNSVLLNIHKEIKNGTSIFEYMEKSRKGFFKQVFSKVMAGEIIRYDRCYTRSGGKIIWINFTFTPVEEVNGISGICITGRDITSEKIAEQQKEFDRNNLNALINNTGDLMWSVDRELKLITSNEAFDKLILAMTGTVPQKGSNILIDAFSKRQKRVYTNFYKRALAGETFTEVEHSKLPGDFWSEISFYPIYEASKVIGTACFSRNITYRKIAEQQLEKSFSEKRALAERMSAIINTLPANIALLNQKGVIVDVNDAWRNFADGNAYTGNNYCVNENYITVAKRSLGRDKEDGSKVATGIKAVLDNTHTEFVHEYPCHSPNEERWFRMMVTPLKEKEYEGAVVMHVDISELRRLEKERLKNQLEEQKKLTQAILLGQEKERNHIGRELHDNINQILAAAKMFLTTAGRKNEAVHNLIQYPVELLDSSIEEIRSLCRNAVTPLKNIDLKELITGILDKINKNSTIKTSLLYAVPCGLLSDDLKLNLYRILQELTNNTLKYAEAKIVTITVKASETALRIIVADDGKGFNVSNKRKGIGISNIINRLESFNGKLQIKSSPGNGCSTVITIPI